MLCLLSTVQFRQKLCCQQLSSAPLLPAGNVQTTTHHPPLVQLKPVATYSPAAEDEGTVRECPICFEEVLQNMQWLLLPCKHGVCTTCYQQLVQQRQQTTTCPFCRMPLLEPVVQPALTPVLNGTTDAVSHHMPNSTQAAQQSAPGNYHFPLTPSGLRAQIACTFPSHIDAGPHRQHATDMV